MSDNETVNSALQHSYSGYHIKRYNFAELVDHKNKQRNGTAFPPPTETKARVTWWMPLSSAEHSSHLTLSSLYAGRTATCEYRGELRSLTSPCPSVYGFGI